MTYTHFDGQRELLEGRLKTYEQMHFVSALEESEFDLLGNNYAAESQEAARKKEEFARLIEFLHSQLDTL